MFDAYRKHGPPRRADRKSLLVALSVFAGGIVFGLIVTQVANRADSPDPVVLQQTNSTNEAQAEAQGWKHRTRDHYLYDVRPLDYSCKRDQLPPGAWYNTATDYGVSPEDTPPGRPLHGEELYGTSEAQRIIYEHQHPADCSTAKFLTHCPQRGGIGSQLHVAGKGLALAMNMGRVYLPVYSGDSFHPTLCTDGPFCEPGSTMDRCFFEPFSSCTLEDAGLFGTVDIYNPGTKLSGFNMNLRGHDDNRTVWLFGDGYDNHFQKVVPDKVTHALWGSAIEGAKRWWWWRAQAAAYMVQPNARTLEELERRRQLFFNGSQILPGTLNAHVRHGDKVTEGAVQDDARYATVAAEAFELAGDSLAGRVFLSTDDPATVEHFKGLGKWEVSYTHTPRKPDSRSNLDYAKEFGPNEEFLNSLLNLQLALDCDAWVGDVGSNWNRLIEELRSTVRCKANGLYLDVRQSNPLQIFGLDTGGD